MKKLLLTLLTATILPNAVFANNEKLSATDYIQRAEDNLRGQSQEGQIEMTIISDKMERTLKFDYWAKDRNKTLIKIIDPIKEAGSGNLRIDLNLWRYLANVDRVVKIPASMMLQNWMGSEFTYDDMVKASSMVNDYTHKIIERTPTTVKIECLPKPTAPVVWGKIVETIRIAGFVTIQREFYTERGEKLKTMTGENIRQFGKHTVPLKLTMENHKKSGSKTVINYKRIRYDSVTSNDIFTQKKLKER